MLDTEKVVPVAVKQVAKAKVVETEALKLLVGLEAKVSMDLISLVETETKEDNKHKADGLTVLAAALDTSVAKEANLMQQLVAEVLVTVTINAQTNAN